MGYGAGAPFEMSRRWAVAPLLCVSVAILTAQTGFNGEIRRSCNVHFVESPLYQTLTVTSKATSCRAGPSSMHAECQAASARWLA